MSIEPCVKLLQERGHSGYGGESVTQLEHALQSAYLALGEEASSELITAALLHDIGHLLHTLPDDAPDRGIDDSHEDLGYEFLVQTFGEKVAEPVRLHVPAKRYLCSTRPEYLEQLSEPSRTSLELQGGLMSAEEVAAFESNRFAEAAIRLRGWDDEAKVPELETPSLDAFIPYLQSAFDNHRANLD